MNKLYFNFFELFKSEIAHKKGYSNVTSNPRILTNLMNLIYFVLNPIRVKLDKPIIIESGFRCPELVEALGSSNKGHPDGECADLSVKGITQVELFNFIRNSDIEYDQLILEHNTDGDCVHIGYRKGACRHQTMTRTIEDGKFVYKNV